MQILHHGNTCVLWEGVEGPSPPGPRGTLYYLRLDRSLTTLTWVRPSWSGLKAGGGGEWGGSSSDPFTADFNLSFNPEETLASGLLTKLALQAAGEVSTGTTIEDGWVLKKYVAEKCLEKYIIIKVVKYSDCQQQQKNT